MFQSPANVLVPHCSICRKPVALETSKTDEDGDTIHEDCYIARITSKMSSTPSEST
jgi:hypothetical protein